MEGFSGYLSTYILSKVRRSKVCTVRSAGFLQVNLHSIWGHSPGPPSGASGPAGPGTPAAGRRRKSLSIATTQPINHVKRFVRERGLDFFAWNTDNGQMKKIKAAMPPNQLIAEHSEN